jgi:poly-gamma-glutamate capsule biosynthesis protein CapA/YwtB (metallophosphatase superfamily)
MRTQKYKVTTGSARAISSQNPEDFVRNTFELRPKNNAQKKRLQCEIFLFSPYWEIDFFSFLWYKKDMFQKNIFFYFGILFIIFFFFLASFFYFKNSSTFNATEKKDIALQEEIVKKTDIFKEKEKLSFIAVGDIMLSRAVAKKMDTKGEDYPFLFVKDFLLKGDIVFGNLETPLTEGRDILPYEMVFRASPSYKNALKDAGFTVLSLANNHMGDFGEKGVKDTLESLESVNILPIGAGYSPSASSPSFIEKKGYTLAFFAYNDSDVVPHTYEAKENRLGTAFMDTLEMQEKVKEAKEKADFVFVSMHSGTEYMQNPNLRQITFARSAIDAGADMVLGHHPHVLQIVEKYKGKYIFYSLGNFIFDQMFSLETREGLLLSFSLGEKGIEDIFLYPTLIEDYSQPHFIEEKEKQKEILERLLYPIEWNEEKNAFMLK